MTENPMDIAFSSVNPDDRTLEVDTTFDTEGNPPDSSMMERNTSTEIDLKEDHDKTFFTPQQVKDFET